MVSFAGKGVIGSVLCAGALLLSVGLVHAAAVAPSTAIAPIAPVPPLASVAAAPPPAPLPAPLPGGQAAPAPQPAPPPSPAVDPQASSCSSSSIDSLVRLVPTQVLQQIVPTTPLISEHADGTVLISRPDAKGVSGDLHFRILLVSPKVSSLLSSGAGKQLDGVVELPVTNTQSASSDAAVALGVINPLGAYLVRFKGPGSSSLRHLNFSHNRVLLAYACSADDHLVASGRTDVRVSRFRLSLLVSVLLIAVIYLGAVTIVWRERNKAAKAVATVQAPQRWHPVQPVSWIRCLDPVVLSGDSFDRGSLSTLQVMAFTLLVVFEMSLLAMRTGVLTDLSPSIVFLLGLPALGSLGAGVATLARDRLSSENWAWLVSRGVLPVNDRTGSLPHWRDIFTNDGELDVYKIQAAAFSAVVALAMLQTGIFSLGKFAVPDTVLQILGLSQLVFVGGRLTKPTTIGDLNDLITELKSRGEALKRAIATGVDVDLDGKPLAAPVTIPGPYADLAAAGAVGAVRNAVQRYGETADEVAVILESVAHAPVSRAALMPSFT